MENDCKKLLLIVSAGIPQVCSLLFEKSEIVHKLVWGFLFTKANICGKITRYRMSVRGYSPFARPALRRINTEVKDKREEVRYYRGEQNQWKRHRFSGSSDRDFDRQNSDSYGALEGTSEGFPFEKRYAQNGRTEKKSSRISEKERYFQIPCDHRETRSS